MTDTDTERKRKVKTASILLQDPQEDEFTIDVVCDHRVSPDFVQSSTESLVSIPTEYEYLVKWKSRSHLRNTWEKLKGLKGL